MACAFMSPRNLMSALGSLCPVPGRLCGVVRLWWLAWFASGFFVREASYKNYRRHNLYCNRFYEFTYGAHPRTPRFNVDGVRWPEIRFPIPLSGNIESGGAGGKAYERNHSSRLQYLFGLPWKVFVLK